MRKKLRRNSKIQKRSRKFIKFHKRKSLINNKTRKEFSNKKSISKKKETKTKKYFKLKTKFL